MHLRPGVPGLATQVLTLAHDVGHEGIQKTLHRLREDFYIPSDQVLIQDFVHGVLLGVGEYGLL